ncbi:hypothetical protein CPB84DRAFT_1847126 [Gymnopilus junonius]|uniref:DUF6533 domain-containing protein n=1 Tax=Gymnopilus junonius TaxID=109634 RepID=A0A9P5NQV8_GYMJU|nr:hypothetical protein CPB84DRAFT_1847126 [Gymnopilus junonius]
MDPTDQLIHSVWQARISSYNWVAGLIFLICDTISTFPREVTYIWSSKWSIPKILYCYEVLDVTPSSAAALAYSTVQILLKVPPIPSSTNPLTESLSRHSLCADVVFSFGLVSLWEEAGSFVKVLLLTIDRIITPIFLVGFVSVWRLFDNPAHNVLLQAIYFLMMAAKFYQSIMQKRRDGVHLQCSPIVRTFLKDGTFYFLLVVVTLVSGGLDALLTTGSYVSLYQPWNAAAFTITGTRLILHLREAAAADASPSIHTEDPIFGVLDTFQAFGHSEQVS